MIKKMVIGGSIGIAAFWLFTDPATASAFVQALGGSLQHAAISTRTFVVNLAG